ncbi:MAG TPA: hypothetical protein EYG57_00950 [Planctomycetes bacterium]|nr:hypothetical protein [Planctomycetaceae bacterium]HIM28102.1 hypothetical protein [Planctomycetota bacterium]
MDSPSSSYLDCCIRYARFYLSQLRATPFAAEDPQGREPVAVWALGQIANKVGTPERELREDRSLIAGQSAR